MSNNYQSGGPDASAEVERCGMFHLTPFTLTLKDRGVPLFKKKASNTVVCGRVGDHVPVS